VYQVGSKDSGSQNFSFPALKGKVVDVTQILCTTAAIAAMARDRRKKIIAQIRLVIHQKSRKMKISEKKFHFLGIKAILPSSLIFHLWQVKWLGAMLWKNWVNKKMVKLRSLLRPAHREKVGKKQLLLFCQISSLFWHRKFHKPEMQ
jgi:hypothetical protein